MGLLTSFQLRSRDAATRARAARKLGVKGKTAEVKNLGPLLEDEDAEVRRAAVGALGTIGDTAVVPMLLKAVRRGPGAGREEGAAAIRPLVVEALAAVGQPAVPSLLDALRDPQPVVRECVVQALGRIGGEEAAAALGQALDDDRSNVRQAAAAGLGRAGGKDAARALCGALDHKDPATRRAAAEALGTLREPSAVPALIQTLSDRERTVRDAAISALAGAATPDAIDALLSRLKSPDRELRQVTAAALRSSAWQPANAEQRSARAVLDGQYAEAAGEGLPAADFLVLALYDKDPAARREAADALARLADPKTTGPLSSLLSDPEAYVRDASARALGAIGLPALPAVIERLEDRSATTRAAASSALQEIGEDRAVDSLLERLSAGEAAEHAGARLRLVRTLEDFERARHAADGLERLLGHVCSRLAPPRLADVAAVADVLLVQPGQTPASGDILSLQEPRDRAAREMSRRGRS